MKRIILVSIMLFSTLLFYSCVDNFKASQYYNCTWVCDAPIIEFTVESKEEEQEKCGEDVGFIMNDGDKIDVVCKWTNGNAIHCFYKDKYYDENCVYFEDKIAFAANYDKRKGNKVYLEVIIDNIFDNKYKNITLTRHDL